MNSNIPQTADLGTVPPARAAQTPSSVAPLSSLMALFGGLGRRIAWRLRGGSVHMANNGRNDGPPDLDELWRDFNKRLSGLFGGKGGGGGRPEGGGGSPSQPPDMRGAGIGAVLIAGVAALIWLGTGVFIVQEGQQGVVMSFGRFSHTVDAGIQWRAPYPFQSHEVVNVTQLRTAEIGRNSTVQATGLRDSSMLTQDENIVDIRFTVQYRLKNSREYLFENRNADEAVVLAAESAVREIVGRSNMDSVLYEQRDAIATDLVKLIQAQLDRLKTGILVANVNVQSVSPPEQVQAAFDDAVKAGADRTRFKNEGQAYANGVIPAAQGQAARLREESEGYRGRVVAMAEGDASRFKQVLTEYQKAPGVTRDRLYTDTMREVYTNVSKVMVDARNGSNLLYLPLDKLIQSAGATAVTNTGAAASMPTPEATTATPPSDARSRENQRTRDRESR